MPLTPYTLRRTEPSILDLAPARRRAAPATPLLPFMGMAPMAPTARPSPMKPVTTTRGVPAGRVPEEVKATISPRGPTKVTKAGRAPELEAQITGYIERLNELAAGYQQAFQAKQGTFADVIRSLQNVYQQRAGVESAAQQQAALASGLTPLESTQLGQQALSQILQQFYPQQAALRAQQADVPIAGQQALQGVSQDYAAMLQGVMAPYYRGVAGTKEFDILGQQQLAAQQQQFAQQAAMQQQGVDVDWQKALLSAQLEQMGMSQQAAQFAAEQQQQMQLAQMGEAGQWQRAMLGEVGAGGRAEMTQAGAMQRAMMGEAGATGRAQMGIGAQQQLATQQQQFQAQQNLMQMLSQIGMAQMGVTGRREVAEIGAGGRAGAQQMQTLRTLMGITGREAGISLTSIMKEPGDYGYRFVTSPYEGVGREYQSFVQVPGGFLANKASEIYGPRKMREGAPTIEPFSTLPGMQMEGAGAAAPPPQVGPTGAFSEEEMTVLSGFLKGG